MSVKELGYSPLAAGIEEIRGSWGWCLTLGILFMALGAVCVIDAVSATFATVLVFGWMLLFRASSLWCMRFALRPGRGFCCLCSAPCSAALPDIS